jgi:hypothetical protein
MDFDTFDTDIWSEIEDSNREIFDLDIPELQEECEDETHWNDFVNSNVTL